MDYTVFLWSLIRLVIPRGRGSATITALPTNGSKRKPLAKSSFNRRDEKKDGGISAAVLFAYDTITFVPAGQLL